MRMCPVRTQSVQFPLKSNSAHRAAGGRTKTRRGDDTAHRSELKDVSSPDTSWSKRAAICSGRLPLPEFEAGLRLSLLQCCWVCWGLFHL